MANIDPNLALANQVSIENKALPPETSAPDTPAHMISAPSLLAFPPLGPLGNSFFNGFRSAVMYWQVLLALYLSTLLPALLLAARPASLVWQLANRPLIADIAAGLPAWLGVDVMGLIARAAISGKPAPGALLAGISSLTWAVLLMPLLGGLVTPLLYGGVLAVYWSAPASFRMRAFLGGCWHWLGCFLLLGVGESILLGLGLVILFGSTALVAARLGSGMLLPGGLLLVVYSLALTILYEVARIQAVAAATRNPIRALGLALRLLIRRPVQIVAFYALSFAVLLGLHALFRLVLIPLFPVTALFGALVVQQGFILTRLFARAARLAGMTTMLK